jgi:hypothetical protein
MGASLSQLGASGGLEAEISWEQYMKAYVITTGAVFGLLTLLHIWRMFVERSVASEPWFILITLASAGLCLWAVRLLSRWPRS